MKIKIPGTLLVVLNLIALSVSHPSAGLDYGLTYPYGSYGAYGFGHPNTIAVAQAPSIAVAQTPTIAVAHTPSIAVAQTPAIAVAQTPTIAVAQTPAVAAPVQVAAVPHLSHESYVYQRGPTYTFSSHQVHPHYTYYPTWGGSYGGWVH